MVVTNVSILRELAKLAGAADFIGHAPACIAVFCNRGEAGALECAVAATQNILLAAAASGLGGCWVEDLPQGFPAQVAARLKAPPGMELATLVSVGVPAEVPGAHARSHHETRLVATAVLAYLGENPVRMTLPVSPGHEDHALFP